MLKYRKRRRISAVSLVISLGTHLSLSLSFESTAAPRFDTFLTAITTGQWLKEDLHKSKVEGHVVEEVMRSCGGAVQGIREFDSYSNRADDSFIFHDCGSYSTGGGIFSFMVKGGTERFVIISSLSCNELVDSKKSASFRIEVMKRKDTIVDKSDKTEILDLTPFEALKGVLVKQSLRCRMSSSTQNWMLQRVRWERGELGEKHCFEEDNVIWLTDPSSNTIGWFSSLDVKDNDGFVSLGATSGLVIGVLAPNSNEMKCIIRGMNDKGDIKFVEFRTSS